MEASMNDGGDSLLTAKVTQERLSISRTTLQKWVKEGRLTAIKFGIRCTRFSRAEVDALVAAHRVHAAAKEVA